MTDERDDVAAEVAAARAEYAEEEAEAAEFDSLTDPVVVRQVRRQDR